MNKKKIDIVIGANYGDEGKGLVTHYLSTNSSPEDTVVVLHNGSAQHGHTVDYNPNFRHVYHHFGCGTAEGVTTYFAEMFWLHPMEFHREYKELVSQNIIPKKVICDPKARIVTPFDMLIDHATEAYITWEHGEPEHGSCGYGTWCATDRYPIGTFTIQDLIPFNTIKYEKLMAMAWEACQGQLFKRNVNISKIPEYIKFFTDIQYYNNIVNNFKNDLRFMLSKTILLSFDELYKNFNHIIFENGQGLGLDMNVKNDWHTTSNTGLKNPYILLYEKDNFEAEVFYVTRSYLTRHGIGPLEETAKMTEINKNIKDITNIPNEFQGSLRFGYLDKKSQKQRINEDFEIVQNDLRFVKSIVTTHCNEFDGEIVDTEYYSNNPFSMNKK